MQSNKIDKTSSVLVQRVKDLVQRAKEVREQKGITYFLFEAKDLEAKGVHALTFTNFSEVSELAKVIVNSEDLDNLEANVIHEIVETEVLKCVYKVHEYFKFARELSEKSTNAQLKRAHLKASKNLTNVTHFLTALSLEQLAVIDASVSVFSHYTESQFRAEF